jgi:peptidoglycan/xylan/chitin deacetylase (PgdA/CDA1 family)
MAASRGSFVVSLDFELHWGMRDMVSLPAYRANLDGTPAAIHRMLDLFEQRSTHVTWAAVGLLFARDSEEARRFAPRKLPTYRARELSPFEAIERGTVDATPGCYFAPDLLEAIAARPNQEIATHTFSHYYCNEHGQTAEQFDADLAAAVAIGEHLGVRIESLVFPRNQSNDAYLPILARHGITSYRGVTAHWAFEHSHSRLGTLARRGLRLIDNYAPVCSPTPTRELVGDPLNIPGSRFLRPYDPRVRQLDELRIHRIEAEMQAAAETGRVYHLWWHPHNFGVHTHANLAILDRLLRHANSLGDRHDWPSRTMAELARAA